MRAFSRILTGVLGALLLVLLAASSAAADTTTTETFHLKCVGTTTCATILFTGGTLISTGMALPNFAISRSPGNNNGLSLPNLWIAVFVPASGALPNFTVNESLGYTGNS